MYINGYKGYRKHISAMHAQRAARCAMRFVREHPRESGVHRDPGSREPRSEACQAGACVAKNGDTCSGRFRRAV